MPTHKTKIYEIVDEKGSSRETIKSCSSAYAKNKRFFGKDSKPFRIEVAHTEEEFKKSAKKLYKPWLKGFCLKGKRVVFKGPKLYQDTYRKLKGTKNSGILMTHEINHIFASQMGMYRGPYWMTEGLAMYVAGQVPGKTYLYKKRITKEKTREMLFYRKVYRKMCSEMYVVGYFGIKDLIDRFGKEKLMKLITSYNKTTRRKDFERIFKKVYGISYNSFLNSFIKNFSYEG